MPTTITGLEYSLREVISKFSAKAGISVVRFATTNLSDYKRSYANKPMQLPNGLFVRLFLL